MALIVLVVCLLSLLGWGTQVYSQEPAQGASISRPWLFGQAGPGESGFSQSETFP
jgi:hypothetical protein